jgi:hypothetical protein|tara:strand:+ start:1627 stop:2244 length:618 start_codon:yes stop_codon:yes gene_type:complete
MAQIFDNALPRESLEGLNALFHDMDFPWFNLNVLALREHEVQLAPKHEDSFASSGFFHLFCDTEQSKSLLPREGNLRINSYHWDSIKPIVSMIAEMLGTDVKKILRCKVNLTTPHPSLTKEAFSLPHCDSDEKHLVALLYVNNSDGDTVIFNEKWNGSYIKEVTIKETISLKENRVVSFNGNSYHAGGIPVHSRERITLNMDFGT